MAAPPAPLITRLRRPVRTWPAFRKEASLDERRWRARVAPPFHAVALGVQVIGPDTIRRSVGMAMVAWPTPYGTGRHWGSRVAPLVGAITVWLLHVTETAGDLAWTVRNSAADWVAFRRATLPRAPQWRWLVAPFIDGVAHSSGAQTVVGLGIGTVITAVVVLAKAVPAPAAPAHDEPGSRVEVALAVERISLPLTDAPIERPAITSTAVAAPKAPTVDVAPPKAPASTRAPSQPSKTATARNAAPSTTRPRETKVEVATEPQRDRRGDGDGERAGKRDRDDGDERSGKRDRDDGDERSGKHDRGDGDRDRHGDEGDRD